jgi:hypothetical protein
MRVTPELVSTVAFLCARARSGQNLPGGTAFFVELPDESDPKRFWTYLVTAQHCLDEISGQDVYVRINTVPNIGGPAGYEDIKTHKGDWYPHWNADVAAILAPYDPARHAIQKVPIELFIGANYRLDISTFDGRGNPVLEPVLRTAYPGGIPVELGHELFFPGLFIQSAGKTRNLPIVRFGHISRMPGDEMVSIRGAVSGTKQIRAFLAEFHSWGGHSGSPVFWHHEYNITLPLNVPRWQPPQSSLLIQQKQFVPERIDVQVARGWIEGLLGLMSAHFDIEVSPKDKSSRRSIEDIITGINAGTAVITPAENIRELLMSDEMKEDRARRAAQTNNEEPAAVADFAGNDSAEQLTLAPNPKDRIKIPIPSKDEVLNVFKKASRKKSH